MAIIEALTGPLGGILAALAGAVVIWLRGRSKGRRDAEQEALQGDVETIKRVRKAQDDSRASGGGWRDRLREQRDD